MQKLLLGCFLFFVCNTLCFAQTLTPQIDRLVKTITHYTYSSQYDSAQTLVFEYLKQKDLSEIEVFYGHFLFADIVKSSGNEEHAIELLLKSKNYLGNISESTIFESLIYGNIGECYFNLQNYPLAKKYALLSIETSPDSSFRGSGHAVNNIIVGFSENLDRKPTSALKYYNNAIQEYLKHGEACELPLCYIKIAAIYSSQNKGEEATRILAKAAFISDSCDIDQYRLLSKMALFDFYKSTKAYEKALATLTEINELNSAISNKRRSELMRDLEVKYEMELHKNENENLKENARILASNNAFKTSILLVSIVALLIILALGFYILRLRNKRNTALSQQLEKIEAQNKERETLLKEVHHRVKNNLQVVTSLLTLQAAQVNDQTTIDQFRQSQFRINAMAKVHEMLYQSGNLSKINIEDYLKDLAESLVNSIKGAENNISLEIVSPPNYLGLDTAIPLGLLINEVITNALVHGIQDKKPGKIYIHLEANDFPNYTLRIGDNGIGCPENITFRNSPSLGLRLMRQLARQLMGSIEKDLSQEGCHYKINFKAEA